MVLVHELSGFCRLGTYPVEPFNKHVLGLSNLLVEKLHEFLNDVCSDLLCPFLRLHSNSGHYNRNWTYVSATILKLSKFGIFAVDVPTIRSPTSHRTKISAWVIGIIACVSRPVHIGIVWIKPESCGFQRKLKQVIVGISRFPIYTFHTLKYPTRKYRSLVKLSHTLYRIFQYSTYDHSSFWKCASSTILARKWKLGSWSRLKSIKIVVKSFDRLV